MECFGSVAVAFAVLSLSLVLSCLVCVEVKFQISDATVTEQVLRYTTHCDEQHVIFSVDLHTHRRLTTFSSTQ
jgi:hypothetical protein